MAREVIFYKMNEFKLICLNESANLFKSGIEMLLTGARGNNSGLLRHTRIKSSTLWSIQLTKDIEFVTDEKTERCIAGSWHASKTLPDVLLSIVLHQIILWVCINTHSTDHNQLVIYNRHIWLPSE